MSLREQQHDIKNHTIWQPFHNKEEDRVTSINMLVQADSSCIRKRKHDDNGLGCVKNTKAFQVSETCITTYNNDNRFGNLKDDSSKEEETETQETEPSIFMVDCDVMVHLLTYLEPPEILNFLTMPLSKAWQKTFTSQEKIWSVLCLTEPFQSHQVHQEDKATNLDDDSNSCDSSDCSIDSFTSSPSPSSGKKNHHGKSRMLYTSFVRCIRYLDKIMDNAKHGRSPPLSIGVHQPNDIASTAGVDIHTSASSRNCSNNRPGTPGSISWTNNNLQDEQDSDISDSEDEDEDLDERNDAMTEIPYDYIARKRNRKSKRNKDVEMKKSREHKKTEQTIPWSCAIYSIVNWMVAFSYIEGIQIRCLKVLNVLLEEDKQRVIARDAGLIDVVLRGMVMFRNSVELNTISLHAIVVLARPLGAREGMLFDNNSTPAANGSGVFTTTGSSGSGLTPLPGSEIPIGFFGDTNHNGQVGTAQQDQHHNKREYGIKVVLESMRHFIGHAKLQAMGCWSFVNLALEPCQKKLLIKHGGVNVTLDAMRLYPQNAEVQYRALFALVNLVIPPSYDRITMQEPGNDTTDEEIVLDDIIGQVVHLAVASMTNFYCDEAILNKACLVFHNLSLTKKYHNVILSTPNCYQMLQWSVVNHRNNHTLQRTISDILRRLSNNSDATVRRGLHAAIQGQPQRSMVGEVVHLTRRRRRRRQLQH